MRVRIKSSKCRRGNARWRDRGHRQRRDEGSVVSERRICGKWKTAAERDSGEKHVGKSGNSHERRKGEERDVATKPRAPGEDRGGQKK